MGKRKEAARVMPFLELLEQGRWWRTRGNEMYRIDRMEQDHRFNLLAYLDSAAPRIAVRKQKYMMLSAFMNHTSYVPDYVLDAADNEIEMWRDDPQKMMRQTPLYRALLKACVDA